VKRICQNVTNVTKWALAQCRGTSLIEARNLSYYMNFFCGHWSEVGLHFYKDHVIESRKCKNCDELINYTVRVSVVVPVSELQMLVKAQSFLRSVAVQVQEL